MPGWSGSGCSASSNETRTFVAGPSVQCPAVSTTVWEISVPEQRNLPSAVVNRTTPTFLCRVSVSPPVMARPAVATIPAAQTASPSVTSKAFRLMDSLSSFPCIGHNMSAAPCWGDSDLLDEGEHAEHRQVHRDDDDTDH